MDQENRIVSVTNQLESTKKENIQLTGLKSEILNTKRQLEHTAGKLRLSEKKIDDNDEVVKKLDTFIAHLKQEKIDAQRDSSLREIESGKLQYALNSMEMEFKKLKEDKEKLEQANNILAGHNNSNQKLKYISSLREDYNKALNKKNEIEKLYYKCKKELDFMKQHPNEESLKLEEVVNIVKSWERSSLDDSQVFESLHNLLLNQMEDVDMLVDIKNKMTPSKRLQKSITSKILTREDSKKSVELATRYTHSKSSENNNPFKN